jgi:hypothetical protein
MQDLLYSYLIQSGSLTLPGIGTVLLKRKPAQSDFVNHRMLPPSIVAELDINAQQARNDLFNYIARHKQVDQAAAIQMLNEFSFNMKNEIRNDSFIWKGVGRFSESVEGNYQLTDAVQELSFLKPVKTQRVVHKHSEHYIKVGDAEKTNVQMSEWLQERDASKREYWPFIALLISLIATTMFVMNYMKLLKPLNVPKKEVPEISIEIR